MRRTKQRSAHAQLNRMSSRWPDLRPEVSSDGKHLLWSGPLRGLQRTYEVLIQWKFVGSLGAPFVFIVEPELKPRLNGSFEEIPHLLFNSDAPASSALCLFDPDGREWDATMLIADTTIPWASEWLHHYECWHLDGIWRGANAPGPISVAEILALEAEISRGLSNG